jgi:hypothetical protein
MDSHGGGDDSGWGRAMVMMTMTIPVGDNA